MANPLPAGDEIDKAIQHIESEIQTQNFDGQPFVPAGALRDFLTLDKINRLLQDIPGADSSKQRCKQIQKKYLAVFVILLSIDEGPHIESFVRNNHLSDDHLPFRHCCDWPNRSQKLFEKFDALQWKFCALVLENDAIDGKDLDPRHVLPIVTQELLKHGESTTSKIRIHAEYNRLRSAVSISKTRSGTWDYH